MLPVTLYCALNIHWRTLKDIFSCGILSYKSVRVLLFFFSTMCYVAGIEHIFIWKTGMPSLSDIMKCVIKCYRRFLSSSKIIFNWNQDSWFYFPFSRYLSILFFQAIALQHYFSNIISLISVLPPVIISSLHSDSVHYSATEPRSALGQLTIIIWSVLYTQESRPVQVTLTDRGATREWKASFQQ